MMSLLFVRLLITKTDVNEFVLKLVPNESFEGAFDICLGLDT